MTSQLLGAKAGGTKTPDILQKKVRIKPLGRGDVVKRAWKLLEADSPRGALNESAEKVLASNENTLAVLRGASSADLAEQSRMEKLLGVYTGTFDYMELLERQFASQGGPREILQLAEMDARNDCDKKLSKPGALERLQKALPWLGGAVAGGVVIGTGIWTWFVGHMQSVFPQFDPVNVKEISNLAGIGMLVGVSSILNAIISRRIRNIEEKRRDAIKGIGIKAHEIRKAVADLVGLEYQRLATIEAIDIGAAVESIDLIGRKMAQIAKGVKEQHGFELILPLEVESAFHFLLHPEHTNWLKTAAVYLHAHLEILFGRKDEHGSQTPSVLPPPDALRNVSGWS